MEKSEIIDIVNSTPALFNARYYKDALTVANWINEHQAPRMIPVTEDEVAAALADQKIHAGTGELL